MEPHLMRRRWQGPAPGHRAQRAPLTQARASQPWLAAGSHTTEQQALRDLDQAWRNFFAGTHHHPRRPKAGRHEGFRGAGAQTLQVRPDNQARSSVTAPNVGPVAFKHSPSPSMVAHKSHHLTQDRARRWHIALAATPYPIPAPKTSPVLRVGRALTLAAALSTGESTSPQPGRPTQAQQPLRSSRRPARAQHGSNHRRRLKTQPSRLKTPDGGRRLEVNRVQDLLAKAMTRPAKGTPDKPGHNVP